MAIGRRANDGFGGDVAAGAQTVLDDEGLPEALRQRLANDARQDVDDAAGSEPGDDPNRPRRIGLRPRYPRSGRERGSTRCQI